MGWWLVLALFGPMCLATRVDPRSGALLGSAHYLRAVYVPAPRTEAPLNPRPGRYQVTEVLDEGNEFTPRPLPRVFYDPRIPVANRRAPVTARPQWEQVDNTLDEQSNVQTDRQRLGQQQQQFGQQQFGQQQLGQQQLGQSKFGQQQQQRRRGYAKKRFRNYENRDDWGRRREYHYGLDDPRIRAGYEDFMRFFGDFSSGKGFGDVGVNAGAGMALHRGAYNMPLYAPTFDLDYVNIVFR